MRQIIFLILIIGLFSCSQPSRLQRTGSYVISKATRQGASTLVELQNVKGSYLMLSDTLKVNDTITINVISIHKAKN